MEDEHSVGRINWKRVPPCGVLAGVVWTVLSSVVTVAAGHAFSAAVAGRVSCTRRRRRRLPPSPLIREPSDARES